MAEPNVIVVIPARYGSTRLPGKPLLEIAGVPMIERVRRIALAAPSVNRVLVATDSEVIRSVVIDAGGEAVMTPVDCRNGTERVCAAMAAIGASDADIIINLQGDAPLTPPWVIDALASAMRDDPQLEFATPATALDCDAAEAFELAKRTGGVGGTTVVFDPQMRALYFSKAVIPHRRDRNLPIYKHIGMYAYRWSMLRHLASLSPTPLELAESLEQLRAIENGIPVRIVLCDYRGRTSWSVDTKKDAEIVEAILEREGELC